MPLIYLLVETVVLAAAATKSPALRDPSLPSTWAYWAVATVTLVLYLVVAYKSPGFVSDGVCNVTRSGV